MKALKVPFDVHGVKPTREVGVKGARDLALSPDAETFAVARRDAPVALFDRSAQPKGTLGIEAHHVAWSNDGKRIATLRKEQDADGLDKDSVIEIHEWPSGKRVFEREIRLMPFNGHEAHCGALAPPFAFSADDTRLYVGSRKDTWRPPYPNNHIHVIDVASGKVTPHDLGDDSDLLSITVDGDRLLALFYEARVGVWVVDEKTLAVRSKVTNVVGEQVLPSKAGAWVVGDHTWAFRIGEAKPPTIRKSDRERRWARMEELEHRAHSKWDRDFLKTRKERRLEKPEASNAARALVHPEPWRVAQAERFGDDDLIVRDGVRVARWHEGKDALEVTPLIEDLQRATPDKGRHTLLSVRKSTLALGWRKAMTDDITITLFDIEA